MMHRTSPFLLPLRRGQLAAWTLAAAFTTAFAPSAPAALDSVISDSPFIPPGWQAPQPRPAQGPALPAPPLTLELHGYSQIGNNVMFSLYDVRNRTSFWISQNDAAHPDIQIVNFDLSSPGNATVEVNDRGRDVQLSLKDPSPQPMAVPPPTPPLVVYSPFDTGGNNNRGGRGGPNGGVPVPAGGGAIGGANQLLRGQQNGAAGGRGGRGGAGANGANGANGAGGGRGGAGGGRGGAGGGAGGGFGGGGAGGGFGGAGTGGGFGTGATTTNNGYTNAGTGFGTGGGGGAARRQIVQPGG